MAAECWQRARYTVKRLRLPGLEIDRAGEAVQTADSGESGYCRTP